MTIQKQMWTILSSLPKFHGQQEVVLKEAELHYLTNVIRLQIGDFIELTNGLGYKASAQILSISKKEAKLVIEHVEQQNSLSPKICVFLALPKSSTLEELVSSASEMGLDEIHIFRTEKCASKAPVKLEKLQRLSLEALRVSKSALCTQVYCYDNFNSFLTQQKNKIDNGINLFCDETNSSSGENSFLKVLMNNFNPQKNIHIIIGPEGSFSLKERDTILKNIYCRPVSLGSNILRVPNAVYSALAIALQVRLESK